MASRDGMPTTDRRFGRPVKGSLATIIGTLKAAVTRRVNAGNGTPGAPLWQRNYYEQIIRNERHLEAVRQYIQGNPAAWDQDQFHPAAGPNRFNQRGKSHVEAKDTL